MPWESGWIRDGLLKDGRGCTVGDDIQPIAVATVVGDSPLIGSKHDGSGGVADSLDLDEPEFARVEVQARHIISEVLFVYVVNLPSLLALVLHDDAHGGLLDFGIRAESLYVGRFTLRVRKHHDGGDTLNRLKRKRASRPRSGRLLLCQIGFMWRGGVGSRHRL